VCRGSRGEERQASITLDTYGDHVQASIFMCRLLTVYQQPGAWQSALEMMSRRGASLHALQSSRLVACGGDTMPCGAVTSRRVW